MEAVRGIVMGLCSLSIVFLSCSQATTPIPGGPSVQTVDDLPEIQLYGCFPNPFSTQTSVAYEIQRAAADGVTCSVYTSSGERIQQYRMPSSDSADIVAFGSARPPTSIGFSTCTWNGESIWGSAPNGVYYIEVEISKNGNLAAQRIACMRRR